MLKQKEDQITGNNIVLTDRRQPSFLYKIHLLYARSATTLAGGHQQRTDLEVLVTVFQILY